MAGPMTDGWTTSPKSALSEAPSDSEGQSSPSDSRELYPPLPVGKGKASISAEMRDNNGRFLPGFIGGGRPKGSRNRLKEAVLATVVDHYKANGKSALDNLVVNDPASYMRIILMLLPDQDNPREDYGDLTEDEVKELLASVYRARKVQELVNSVGG